MDNFVIARGAATRQSSSTPGILDCFAMLAMTMQNETSLSQPYRRRNAFHPMNKDPQS
jgi:hypothetical protein